MNVFFYRLNPYSIGIWIELRQWLNSTTFMSLNPYSIGIWIEFAPFVEICNPID